MHCLSFDVEEHFQVSAFESPLRRQNWGQEESRVERNVSAIVDLLAIRGTKATFFTLGWIAERHPRLVKQLADAGHEIASHGYGHEMITAQTPDQFREDVRKAKSILENLTGRRILGYRAPSFTITEKTKWALQILVEEGYGYDSSIVPVRHDRYGMPGANPWCHEITTEAGSIWEVPPSTSNLFGLRLPVAGGGYFRLYPYPLLRTFLRRVESEQQPLVMYLHPWELDPEQPRMAGPLLSRFRHYLNLSKTAGRLSRLLRDFDFAPIRTVVQPIAQQWKAEAHVNQRAPMAIC
ncbi:MAG: XrtA system polysaccharide deacetylase [Nitrospira sp.]